eukprot:UN24136
MFFMITYTLINGSCFFLEYFKSPGWRPSFKYFNCYTAGFGSLTCFVIMFMTSWYIAIIALCIAGGIYKYIEYTNPPVNWGSAMQSRNYVNAIENILQLRKCRMHIKNFRPNFLIMTGTPEKRKHLVYFGQTLRELKSLIIYGDIEMGDYKKLSLAKCRKSAYKGYVSNVRTPGFVNDTFKIKGLYSSVICPDYRMGSLMLLQITGLGVLKPNTLVLGYKEKFWLDERMSTAEILGGPTTVDYVNIVRDCFNMGFNCMICRNLDALSWHEENAYAKDDNIFSLEQGLNTIDVWWVVDDGGLSLLVPYMLAQHKFWKRDVQHVRVLIPITVMDFARIDEIKATLEEYRLDLHVVPVELPNDACPEGDTIVRKNKEVKDGDKDVTEDRWMRFAELIRENSKNAKLVFITIPTPEGAKKTVDLSSEGEIVSHTVKSLNKASPKKDRRVKKITIS